MSGIDFDPSHNYEHIQRVINNANRLYLAEMKKFPDKKLDTLALFLACLVHDIADHKYAAKFRVKGVNVDNMVKELLLNCGSPPELADKVETIAKAVSFTEERSNPQRAKEILAEHPELAFVQDADRLDAMGAVGQARVFVFGGSDEIRRRETIHRGIQYHWEKLHALPLLMKTQTARDEAEELWTFMSAFRRQWAKETDISSVLKPEE